MINMKKFIITTIDSVIMLAVICAMVASCVMEQPSHKENETLSKHVNIGEMFDDIYEFNYNGHQYIWFRQFNGFHTGWDGGIVHNPDCECGYNYSNIEYD